MKIGERGQVTIPKTFRDRMGLTAATEVEFVEKRGELILQKRASDESREKRARIKSCVGVLRGQPANVDGFIDEIRGR